MTQLAGKSSPGSIGPALEYPAPAGMGRDSDTGKHWFHVRGDP